MASFSVSFIQYRKQEEFRHLSQILLQKKQALIISNSLTVYYSIIKFNINIVCTYTHKSVNQKLPIFPQIRENKVVQKKQR